MKILLLCEYPPMPAGLATQGELLLRGLQELGIEVYPVHLESALEKEWYFRWFKPDLALGIGYWGYAPHILHHPQQFGVPAVPWLVADGYIANYLEDLNRLPLILVTSHWVRDVYIRDGVRPDIIEVLPVGCDLGNFIPRAPTDPMVSSIRETLGVSPDHLMILTVGGDGASKGSQEVMEALARIDGQVPEWRYVCKVWPQPRTTIQNEADLQLAARLGIARKVIYATSCASRNYMPYLLSACDIYAGPSRLEGFGMPHVEAGACARPVIGINAMAFRDTLVHGETALLAGVAKEIRIAETVIYQDAFDSVGKRVIFDPPRIADYRASIDDLAQHLLTVMRDADMRRRMGEAGRRRALEYFDYRVVARRLLQILARRLPGLVSAGDFATGSVS